MNPSTVPKVSTKRITDPIHLYNRIAYLESSTVFGGMFCFLDCHVSILWLVCWDVNSPGDVEYSVVFCSSANCLPGEVNNPPSNESGPNPTLVPLALCSESSLTVVCCEPLCVLFGEHERENHLCRPAVGGLD